MFCDGECKTKRKKCGLLTTVWVEDKMTGKKQAEEKCVFLHILDSSIRAEYRLDGIHEAENGTRNEATKGLREIKDTIGIGLSGMLKSVEGRKKIER
jgi:hypothetical protein